LTNNNLCDDDQLNFFTDFVSCRKRSGGGYARMNSLTDLCDNRLFACLFGGVHPLFWPVI